MRLTETHGPIRSSERWPKWTNETQIVARPHDPVFVRPVLHTQDDVRSHWVDIRIGALDDTGAKFSDYAPAAAAEKAAQLRADAERAESSGGTVQFVIHLNKTSRRTKPPLTPAEARQVAHAIDETRRPLADLPMEKQPSTLQPLADQLLFDVIYLERIKELLYDRLQIIFQGPPGTGKTYAGRAASSYPESRASRRLIAATREAGLRGARTATPCRTWTSRACIRWGVRGRVVPPAKATFAARVLRVAFGRSQAILAGRIHAAAGPRQPRVLPARRVISPSRPPVTALERRTAPDGAYAGALRRLERLGVVS